MGMDRHTSLLTKSEPGVENQEVLLRRSSHQPCRTDLRREVSLACAIRKRRRLARPGNTLETGPNSGGTNADAPRLQGIHLRGVAMATTENRQDDEREQRRDRTSSGNSPPVPVHGVHDEVRRHALSKLDLGSQRGGPQGGHGRLRRDVRMARRGDLDHRALHRQGARPHRRGSEGNGVAARTRRCHA